MLFERKSTKMSRARVLANALLSALLPAFSDTPFQRQGFVSQTLDALVPSQRPSRFERPPRPARLVAAHTIDRRVALFASVSEGGA